MDATANTAAGTPATANTAAGTPATATPPDDKKITLGELADAYEVLQGFANQPLDGITAAKAVRLGRWCRPHYLRYTEIRGKEAERFGEKVAEGKYRVGAERMAEYSQAMALTRAGSISIDPSLKLDIRTLEGVKITPAAIEALEPLLTGI